MAVSKSQMAANKKYDKEHFKYQSVKLKLSEYEALKKAIEISKMPMNTFLRSAIMCKVAEYVDYNGGQAKRLTERARLWIKFFPISTLTRRK